MELASGYWQVAMSPETKRKAAFVTNVGLFQFRVMPFGLCNAPATFKRLMDRVLCGMRWSRCLVYLDFIREIYSGGPRATGGGVGPGGGTRDINWWGCALAHQKRGVLGAGTAQKGGS